MNGHPSRFGSSSGSHQPNTTKTHPRLGWRHIRWVLAAATVPLALWACNAHPLEQPKPAPEQQTDLVYEVNPVRKLDLLFVVDNSNSMMQEQANLKKNFPDFMNELTKIQGGVPDLHIAVVSSNVGAGPTQPAAECPPGGDRGAFQIGDHKTPPADCGLDPGKDGYFLTVDGTGKTNFEAQGGLPKLPELFGCMATLGIQGCGYEHHLLSMYFALDGKTNTAQGRNGGFLRDDAYLGIVVIADEDDCSGSPSADFFKDAIGGQSGSLRCALKGHTCNGQEIAAMPFSTNLNSPPLKAGDPPQVNCSPYERKAGEENSRLIDVKFFSDFVKSLKYSQDKILVSTVIGWSDSLDAKYALKEINTTRGLELDLAPICEDAATGSAAPGIRLHSFAKSFANNTVHPICNADLKQAMTEIGVKLRTILENTCITSPLFDTDEKTPDIQADCQVFDQVPVNGKAGSYKDVAILPCESKTGGPRPETCWELKKDPMCMSGYRTTVDRPTPADPGTLQSIRCLTCPVGSTDPRCVAAP
jgi:hypothetical protein